MRTGDWARPGVPASPGMRFCFRAAALIMTKAAGKAGMWEYKNIQYPGVQMRTVQEILEEKRTFQTPTRIVSKIERSEQIIRPH